MNLKEWKALAPREKEARFRCSVYCVHAFQDSFCDWFCGRCKTRKKLDLCYPTLCRHYEERPQLGTKLNNSCVISCALQLDSHIEAMIREAKRKGGRHVDA